MWRRKEKEEKEVWFLFKHQTYSLCPFLIVVVGVCHKFDLICRKYM